MLEALAQLPYQVLGHFTNGNSICGNFNKPTVCHRYADVRVCCTGSEQRLLMAEALAKLPVTVLWRLSPKEIPDSAAVEALHLGNNTRVGIYSVAEHFVSCSIR